MQNVPNEAAQPFVGKGLRDVDGQFGYNQQGSIPFTRSTVNQGLAKQCNKPLPRMPTVPVCVAIH